MSAYAADSQTMPFYVDDSQIQATAHRISIDWEKVLKGWNAACSASVADSYSDAIFGLATPQQPAAFPSNMMIEGTTPTSLPDFPSPMSPALDNFFDMTDGSVTVPQPSQSSITWERLLQSNDWGVPGFQSPIFFGPDDFPPLSSQFAPDTPLSSFPAQSPRSSFEPDGGQLVSRMSSEAGNKRERSGMRSWRLETKWDDLEQPLSMTSSSGVRANEGPTKPVISDPTNVLSIDELTPSHPPGCVPRLVYSNVSVLYLRGYRDSFEQVDQNRPIYVSTIVFFHDTEIVDKLVKMFPGCHPEYFFALHEWPLSFRCPLCPSHEAPIISLDYDVLNWHIAHHSHPQYRDRLMILDEQGQKTEIKKNKFRVALMRAISSWFCPWCWIELESKKEVVRHLLVCKVWRHKVESGAFHRSDNTEDEDEDSMDVDEEYCDEYVKQHCQDLTPEMPFLDALLVKHGLKD